MFEERYIKGEVKIKHKEREATEKESKQNKRGGCGEKKRRKENEIICQS